MESRRGRVFFVAQLEEFGPWVNLRGVLGGSSHDLDTWLITMVIVSPLNGVIPLINGLNGL